MRYFSLAALFAALAFGLAWPTEIGAQGLVSPPPGSVYKEYTKAINAGNNDWRVTDPNATYVNEENPESTNIPSAYLPNERLALTIDDLQGAVRAEVLIDLWGGHVGTTGKRFRFNNNSWITIPELTTTPSPGQCYAYQSNVVIDLPLGHIFQGKNLFEGTTTGQDCFNWNWGQWGWYLVTVRIYYDETRSHPMGTITSHSSGALFGDNPTFTTSASSPVGISRVEYYAFYDGYDTDGDGVYQQYHHSYQRARNLFYLYPQNHVGDADSPPWSVTWDTTWVPDQDPGSIKVVARVTDSSGMKYVTQELTNLTLHRVGSSVRLFKPLNVPQNHIVYGGLTRQTGFDIPTELNLTAAVGAKLLIRTWNGVDGDAEVGETHSVKINNAWTAPPFGANHYFSYDELDFPPTVLQNGYNTIEAYSGSSHHGIEVLWPGPAAVVRFEYPVPPPATPTGVAGTPLSDISVTLDWADNSEFEIAGYSVHRSTQSGFAANSGNKILHNTPVSSMTDGGLSESTTYYYRVVAVNIFGDTSPASAEISVTTLPDTTPANLVSVTPLDQNTIRVVFDDVVEQGSAQDPSHYAITFVGGTVAIAFAQLQSDGTTVILTTYPLFDDIQYELAINGVTDLAQVPNPTVDMAPFVLDFDMAYHWPLDDAAGVMATELIQGHNGTLMGPLWNTNPGQGSPAALSFDGVNDSLSFGALDLPSNTFTVSLWFRAASFNLQDGRLLSKATGLTDQEHYFMLSPIDVNGESRLRFRLKTGGTTGTLFANSGALTVGVWTHVAAVYDGSFMLLYKDGVQIGSLQKSGAITMDPTVNMAMGNQPSGAGQRPFHGDIDELRIYSRALSLSEIQKLAVSPAPPCLPPLMAMQPVGGIACTDSSMTLSVTAQGSGPFGYQWHQNGSPIAGANSSSLTISSITEQDAGQYGVSITNGCGSTESDTVQITVQTPPTVTAQPVGTTVCEQETVSFSVAANGTPPLSYQWRKNGMPLANETSSTLALGAVSPTDAATYDVVVTNVCGSVTSAPALLMINLFPQIVVAPVNETVCESDSLVLSVTATGTEPLSYQWRKNGVAIPGEIGTMLPINDATVADAGTYDVVVTNLCGVETSVGATVTIQTHPVIVEFSDSSEVCDSTAFVLSVSATGSEPMSYQWRKNGADLPGANSTTLTISSMSFSDVASYSVVVSNGCSTVTSGDAALTLLTPPVITLEPLSQNVCAGTPVTFTAGATGSAPLQFQWRRDGNDIPGANSDTLSLPAVAPEDAGMYELVATNSCGVATTGAASLTVTVQPGIVTGPESQAVCEGDSVTFSVFASGTNPLGYQWRVNGIDIPGATTDTYAIGNVTSAHSGNYDVRVTNICGAVTSNSATLTVQTAPSILTQPVGVSGCEGSRVSLNIVAAGSGPLLFQWRKDGVDINGATGNVYTIDEMDLSTTGVYEVVVSNNCGSLISAPAGVDMKTMPNIVTQPTDQNACAGDTVMLSVVAAGTAPIGYQWRINGVNVPGATSPNLVLSNVTDNNAGMYEVLVSNDCGSVTSQAVSLTVLAAPIVLTPPASQLACVGDDVVLNVTVHGPEPLTYQWFKNGAALPGETLSSLTLSGVTLAEAGDYRVRVNHNPCGSVMSAEATVSIEDVPAIVAQPIARSTCEGFGVEFSVIANGSSNLTYQWRFEGANIDGETGPTLSLASPTLAEAGLYQVVVIGNCGFVASDEVALMVVPMTQCDCNGNNVLDGDDLTMGDSLDCNNNGVPDECDIANGFSADIDGNNIPDECSPEAFVRGDCSADGEFNLVDAITLLDFLFTTGQPVLCNDACDVDDEGSLNLSDVINMLCALFCSPAPDLPPPFGACGVDPTTDALDCADYTCP
ncbi:MAG: immunoglobulin domain-containing protein [Planctomycetota bacterium]